ncbi:SDR family NAD(P)-dependent oxidoreductase [Roseitranquillus sediminis]|uniref:SDR family NAD(P)-dependent oxidoreductase n=1 Tax=Roseitranquillus sediminis TaxID=2809051 RepID=UPI001D0C8A66|nr:SDR family NAD(P)-dependent oxidoreductase [Roseitranquillus sediminis]MBM9594527.1 SDR family NAD(P)-dependent oxidoreductase [Roseitranquillus sediminis]
MSGAQRALVIGTSGGIGTALATELANRGAEVTGLSRSGDGLDVTDEASVVAALGRLDAGYDLVFVATGTLGEPEKALSALAPEAFLEQIRTNALGPALVLKHALPLLASDRRAVFAVLSARVGSIGDNAIGGWYSYRASKACLNQLMHTAAIEIRRTHRNALCVALHPGTVATEFTARYAGRHRTVEPDEAARNLLDVLDGLTPEQSGGFYDYSGKPVPW